MNDQTEKLREKNIDLYYVVVPNKSSVYYEFLPNNIHVSEDYFDTVYKKMKNEKAINNLYYNLDLLRKMKSEHETYYRTDTHWTDFGAYIYFKDLFNKIYNENLFEDEEIDEQYINSYGLDLHNFFGVLFKIKDTKTNVNYSNKSEIKPKKIKKSYGYIEEYENNDYKLDETVVIIGDSFTNNSTNFFASIYKKVIRIYLNNTEYDSSVLDEYNPSKIFYIRNERFTLDGLNFEFTN